MYAKSNGSRADPRPRAATAASAQSTSHPALMRRLDRLAAIMDDRFRIPFTNLRFGMDSVVGLVPGVGDAATTAVSALIVHQAWQAGVPQTLLARMAGNVAIDAVLGAIPLAGDLFDFSFKANRRNVWLLRQHFATLAAPRGKGLFRTNGARPAAAAASEKVSA